jgi:hypothetical protein
MARPISHQVVLLITGFVVVLAISAASVLLIRQSQAGNDRVTRALTVINLTATFRADLRRAESGQRGFLLTAKSDYLSDYNATRGRLLPGLDQLSKLLGADRVLAADLDDLRAQVNSKLDEMAQTLQLELSGNHQGALAIVGTDRGLTLTQQITDGFAAIAAEEQADLTAAQRAAGQIDIALFAVNLIGIVAVSGLAYVSFVLFRRNARLIVANQDELRQLNAELEDRVTERTADLEEANAEIQRYAYVVTHDLRSPLVNIMGFTSELEALREPLFAETAVPAGGEGGPIPTRSPEELRADFDEAIHFIKTSIAKMDGLINAILKLSRAGRREINIQTLDLNDVVEVIAADFRHRLKELGGELSIGELPRVRSDRMAIEQIVSNLVDNALKYLRRDVPGRISVTAEETPTAYRIHVTDNGRGIAANDQARVFELFRRAGPQDTPGEGIGLAHARGLARRIGGALGVAVNPAGGSIFTLTLSKLWMARQAAAGRKQP